VPPKRGYMEDLCEWVIQQNKACYFCGQPRTLHTNKHYIFCPNCMSLYTYMLVQESNCEHIKDGVPTLRHEPHSKYTKGKIYVYEDHEGEWYLNRCSICRTDCDVGGW